MDTALFMRHPLFRWFAIPGRILPVCSYVVCSGVSDIIWSKNILAAEFSAFWFK